MLKTVQKCH